MQKIKKLFTLFITFLSAFFISGCSCNNNEAQYQNFEAAVKANETFFGFLGYQNNDNTKNLINTVEYVTKKDKDNMSLWTTFLQDNDLNPNKKILLQLHAFVADNNYSSTSEFWNDPAIKWQQKIFQWIQNKNNRSENFANPLLNEDTKNIQFINDNDKVFADLPVFFVISHGKLLTKGYGWEGFNEINDFDHSWKQLKNIILECEPYFIN